MRRVIFTILICGLVLLAWLVAIVLPRLVAIPAQHLARVLDPNTNSLGRLAQRVLGPSLSEAPLMIGLALVLIVGCWGFAGVLEDVVMGDPIVGLDHQIYGAVQDLRAPSYDRLMIAATMLGDQQVFLLVALAALSVCIAYRHWRAAAFLAVAGAGGALFVGGIKMIIRRARPVSIYDGVAEYSFPSGHAAMSIVLVGFIGLLIAHGASGTWRRLAAFGTLAGLLIIAFSRIYLGAHWFSDVAAGLMFGLAWVALLGIIYLRVEPKAVPTGPLAGATLIAYILAGSWHIDRDYAAEAKRYAVPQTATEDTHSVRP